ncbi:helix-turn-helix transcriptional regulator [bacterium LRH843]|nr:helix-turn-helix transcriptional regulator [bacterium LRH843]
MDYSRIAPICLTIFQLTDINTFMVDENGIALLAYEHNHLPEFLYDIEQKSFSFIAEESKHYPHQCCLYTNESGLSYLASIYQRKDGNPKILINGPFLQQTPNILKLQSTFNIDSKKKIVLEKFFGGLKLISTSRIQSTANVLNQISSIHQAPISILKELPVYSTEPPIHSNLQNPDEKYVQQIELRYKFENEVMQAVQRGDKEKLRETLSEWRNFYDWSDSYPNQPVRSMKNRLISLNTTLRIAAEKGNVYSFFFHHVYEKFSHQIETIESIDKLNLLLVTMCEEYCELVNAQTVSGFSMTVQKAINYLTVYFRIPLDLGTVAKHCFVHPAHLSRQFKKETGMTITEFSHKIRIDEAKILLKSEHLSIDAVAESVGFDDAGYFSRVFKKREGMTPLAYRNN